MIEKEFVPKPVPIITDGIQATRSVGEGRWIPIFILDLGDRPDVREVLRHRPSERGEIRSQWGRAKKYPMAFFLFVEFLRPVRCEFQLMFDAASQGALIDYALDSEAVYLQAGRPGDRVSDLVDEPRLLLEVPVSDEMREEWEKAFRKAMTLVAREKGLGRRAAKRAARRIIEEVRTLRRLRMKPLV